MEATAEHPGGLERSLDALREEMAAYYRPLRCDVFQRNPRVVRVTEAIGAHMERFAAERPACSAVRLKAELLGQIAERFEPVIFPHSPFFFEMGLRPAENWGTPAGGVPSAWVLRRTYDRIAGHPAFPNIRAFAPREGGMGLAQWESVFDADHHCLGYTALLQIGVRGVLDRIRRERERNAADPSGRDFLESAELSCLALVRTAERFAAEADRLLPSCPDAQAAEFLRRISSAARRVPAGPPETFYEGLAALWFLREAVATLEGIGISVIGHPDRHLIGLYRADLAAGRLTRDEAGDLLARWMLPTDVKFHVADSAWPETSTCMALGGCDAGGREVFNELTELIVETHRRHRFLNPKPNCRYSSRSPQPYLDLLASAAGAGHNCFAFLNDDVLIPACVRSGKSEAEARLYVNGGCQETIVEGVEHSAGAYYYFCLPRVLDLCLQPAGERTASLPAAAAAALPQVIVAADTFDAFYAAFLGSVDRAMAAGAGWRREAGRLWRDVHPCPLFSATLEGCIESGRDYTAGGAKYNPATVAVVGFATTVDSLYAIRRAVYDERWLTLTELRQALAGDWRDAEVLRQRLVALPKFGHGEPDVDTLAGRLAADLAGLIRALTNERDGRYQPSLFVYYAFSHFAKAVRATPDGRHAGDLLSQGVSPGRLRAPRSVTDVLHSVAAVDFRDFAANAVVDLQLPLGGHTSTQAMSGLIRTFARMGGPTLQTNVVSVAELKDAKAHPQHHPGLVVRISGLSAHFVALEPAVQDEIIARVEYDCA